MTNRKAIIIAAVIGWLVGAPGVSADIVQMYWTNPRDGLIHRANLDGTGSETVVSGLTAPQGIALDMAGGKMYWTDVTQGKIQRANLDGTGVEDVLSGLTDPLAIDLDVGSGQLYWTTGSYGSSQSTISRANLDGTGSEHLVQGTGRLYGLALDPAGGEMYWSHYEGGLSKANLDGSDQQFLYDEDSFAPGGLDLDLASGKIYSANLYFNKVHSVNLDGTSAEELVATYPDYQFLSDVALDLDGGKMYFAASRIGTYPRNGILRANLDGSGLEAVVTTAMDMPPNSIALTPEPSTLGLLVLGGLTLLRRRP